MSNEYVLPMTASEVATALAKALNMEEVINNAVEAYMESRVPTVTIGWVTLLASAWQGTGSLYSQVVSIDGVTEKSQVNLKPSLEQLAIFYNKNITFSTKNVGGVVTAYVIGQKPENDYTIQVEIVQVSV